MVKETLGKGPNRQVKSRMTQSIKVIKKFKNPLNQDMELISQEKMVPSTLTHMTTPPGPLTLQP